MSLRVTKKPDYAGGFTLLELLVSIALLYVVLGIAIPSAKRMLDINKIAADINHTNAIIRFARTTAISQYQTIKICPAHNHVSCSTDWAAPLIVFADNNSNNVRDANEPLLAASSALRKQHKMKGPKSAIQFHESGENASPASLTLCPKTNDNTLARALYISLQGRIRLSVDYNNDGVHERVKKVKLVCTSF
jgi:type IV fimbrial biogenesis protein FimT